METVDSQETDKRERVLGYPNFLPTLEVTLSVCTRRGQYLLIPDTQRVNKVTQWEAEVLNVARNVEWLLVIG